MPKIDVDLSIVATAPTESFDQVRFFLESLPEDEIPADVRPHIKPVADALTAITNDTDVIMTQEDYEAAKAEAAAENCAARQARRPR